MWWTDEALARFRTTVDTWLSVVTAVFRHLPVSSSVPGTVTAPFVVGQYDDFIWDLPAQNVGKLARAIGCLGDQIF